MKTGRQIVDEIARAFPLVISIGSVSALSRRKQGFESPRERHVICSFLYFQNLSGLFV